MKLKQWFGRSLMVLATSLTVITLTVDSAEARRLGGGRTIGKQSNTVTQQRQAAPQQAAPQQATPQQPAAQPARNRWLGPLAGLAAGLGIAALLSHFGLGEGFANIVMIALLVFAAIFLIRWLMRKFAKPAPTGLGYKPAYQYSYMGQETVPAPPPSQLAGRNEMQRNPVNEAAITSGPSPVIPAGFDVENFVRNAKVSFIRLQAAFDTANLDDLREFTSPEMFAELRLQLQERGSAAQRTDVVTLNASLLGVETHGAEYLASVRFSGMLREEADQAATPIDEVWNFARPVEGSSGWVLAGIQQLS